MDHENHTDMPPEVASLPPQIHKMLEMRARAMNDPNYMKKLAVVLASGATPPSVEALMARMGAGAEGPSQQGLGGSLMAQAGATAQQPMPKPKPQGSARQKQLDAMEVKAGSMTVKEFVDKWGEVPPTK